MISVGSPFKVSNSNNSNFPSHNSKEWKLWNEPLGRKISKKRRCNPFTIVAIWNWFCPFALFPIIFAIIFTAVFCNYFFEIGFSWIGIETLATWLIVKWCTIAIRTNTTSDSQALKFHQKINRIFFNKKLFRKFWKFLLPGGYHQKFQIFRKKLLFVYRPWDLRGIFHQTENLCIVSNTAPIHSKKPKQYFNSGQNGSFWIT